MGLDPATAGGVDFAADMAVAAGKTELAEHVAELVKFRVFRDVAIEKQAHHGAVDIHRPLALPAVRIAYQMGRRAVGKAFDHGPFLFGLRLMRNSFSISAGKASTVGYSMSHFPS